MHHVSNEEIRGWFTGRIPTDWFSGPVTISGDREEILVVGELADVVLAAGASDVERAAARESRAGAFREDTRAARMRIADDAEQRFDRKVAWGVTIGGEAHTFTTLSIPVMTRLRMRDYGCGRVRTQDRRTTGQPGASPLPGHSRGGSARACICPASDIWLARFSAPSLFSLAVTFGSSGSRISQPLSAVSAV